jgi:hypothetical protein
MKWPRVSGVSFSGLSTISPELLGRAKHGNSFGSRPISKLGTGLGVGPAANKLSRWAGKRAAETLWTIPEKETPLTLYPGYHCLMPTLLNVTNNLEPTSPKTYSEWPVGGKSGHLSIWLQGISRFKNQTFNLLNFHILRFILDPSTP